MRPNKQKAGHQKDVSFANDLTEWVTLGHCRYVVRLKFGHFTSNLKSMGFNQDV